MLTLVMYHYVRDLPRSRYPAIKGRRTDEFEAQLDYIQRHHSVVRIQDVLAAARGERSLPELPCVLTFDDGLSDHFETVFPRLMERGIPGAFFPSARPIRDQVVLDVHKIHFVLASTADHDLLLRDVSQLIASLRREHDLPSEKELIARYRLPNKYDSTTTAFLKRLLQHALPSIVRERVVDELFRRHVAVDEATFSRELYMDRSQLRCLLKSGMEIGGHGDHHEHMGLLSPERQVAELCASRAFLNDVYDESVSEWIMCFPYGSFSADTLDLAAHQGCRVALSCKAELVALPLNSISTSVLVLDRLDTNDIPCSATASPCEWTLRARRER
ncbi:MAG TPA: polysaccharide deacetylase family protein [Gemmatimonadaceae bacterium]|jgi:peptidoglycan/xylan/chitin deacetylase (PgdA/CDA1 family)